MILEVKSMSFSYDATPIFEEISFQINKEEVVVLLGKSGVGKTTLFRLITGLEKPSSGSIYINGKESLEGVQFLSYMSQDDLLLPWRSVWENLFLFTELGVMPVENKEELIFQAEVLLKKFCLFHKRNSYPKELSGGMKQRVALARSLLQNKPLLLLDEPFSATDVLLREKIYEDLLSFMKETRRSFLLITHDFRDAFSLADRIFILLNKKIEELFLKKKPKELSFEEKENAISSIKEKFLFSYQEV